MNFEKETIWIIGASSGIGRELAIQLAKKGATLILSARREKQLAKLQKELGSSNFVYPLDVAKHDQIKIACNTVFDMDKKIDRVIFMSAVYEPSSIAEMNLGLIQQTVAINLTSVFYISHAVLAHFEKQRSGQIVFCSSVVAYTGLPYGQPYSATKAALLNFAESLYAEKPDYIDVKVISPGFVQTDMTAKNDFDMPMIIKVDQAANAIVKGLNKKAFDIHFPKKFTLLLKFLSILPYKFKLAVTQRAKKIK